MADIDTDWFHQQLSARNTSVRGLARFMGVDASAVSRMLKGERKMSAEEQDKITIFLGLDLAEVAARRRGELSGFAEGKQTAYRAGAASPAEEPPMKMFTADDVIYKDGKRWMERPDGTLLELHPAFGCMAGTMTIPDDLDLTAPIDVEWSDKLYNE
ncbi:helix-turn-helix domain-containing protein [Pararhizobium sp.]|uniref:helix-turn-helix domain-containing protein n=1 Tax=Pararhizobium sp. TaxID=1977563 RepID=UPI002719F896|nr:helix-turn-helix transcriptional regulator [Pararhizobium sp.]MDO9414605.1 helix-turn-helix transcriptional regulator [Pararhizobium sp.]